MIKTKNTEVKFPLGNQAISARTLRKDNLWRILIEVTYHNNYALVKELVENKNFDEHILSDIGLLNVPFPLYYITMCYKRTMWGGFREEIMPFVESQRENIDLLLQFWHERFNVDTDEIIDYKKYEEYFFCFSDDETAEDVFLDPIQKFLDNGCLKIDLDLFEAVEKFQFDKVRNLLLQGANPNANLLPIDDKNSDDYFNCLDRIGTECGYLCTCQIFPIIKNDVWCSNYALDAQNIGDLIGWATHEDNVQPT